MSPPGQFCFTHTIGSAYTLTRWSVTVVGNHERETIIGVSHQPTGDLVTTMHDGARTRVTGVGGFHAMARFLGVWTYDPASRQTLVNMVVTVPSGAGLPSISPVQGAVRFASEHYGTILAHTADGCRWTLAVQGNTAELDPATQTCQLATGTVTLLFWSAASDGEHQNSVMAGSTDLNGQRCRLRATRRLGRPYGPTRDHPARTRGQAGAPAAAGRRLAVPAAGVAARRNDLDAGVSVGPDGSSRRVRASAERGRVQGPGRAEADLGPRTVTATGNSCR